MSDFVTMWKNAKSYELDQLAHEAADLEEAAKAGVGCESYGLKTLAILAVLVCSAAPAMAVSAANGYFDGPAALWDPRPVQRQERPGKAKGAPERPVLVFPVTVTARRIVQRAPMTCKTRELDLYGGKVRVCARPASPIVTRKTGDLL